MMFSNEQGIYIIILSLIILVVIIYLLNREKSEMFSNFPNSGNCLLKNLKNLDEIRNNFEILWKIYFIYLKMLSVDNIIMIIKNIRDQIISMTKTYFGYNPYLIKTINNNLRIMQEYVASVENNDLSKQFLFSKQLGENMLEIGKTFDYFLNCCKVKHSFDGKFSLCDNKYFTKMMTYYSKFLGLKLQY